MSDKIQIRLETTKQPYPGRKKKQTRFNIGRRLSVIAKGREFYAKETTVASPEPSDMKELFDYYKKHPEIMAPVDRQLLDIVNQDFKGMQIAVENAVSEALTKLRSTR